MRTRWILIFLFLHSSLFAKEKEFYNLTGVVYAKYNNTPINGTYITLYGSNQRYGAIQENTIGKKLFYKISNIKKGMYHLKISQLEISIQIDTIIAIDRDLKLDFYLSSNCTINKESAVNDIKNNVPRLLLQGGYAPTFSKSQEIFEKKYRVKYWDFGDVIQGEDCLIEYNDVVFNWLDQQYGKKWRREVRKDVIGFK